MIAETVGSCADHTAGRRHGGRLVRRRPQRSCQKGASSYIWETVFIAAEQTPARTPDGVSTSITTWRICDSKLSNACTRYHHDDFTYQISIESVLLLVQSRCNKQRRKSISCVSSSNSANVVTRAPSSGRLHNARFELGLLCRIPTSAGGNRRGCPQGRLGLSPTTIKDIASVRGQ